jgi:hypothetical protein
MDIFVGWVGTGEKGIGLWDYGIQIDDIKDKQF